MVPSHKLAPQGGRGPGLGAKGWSCCLGSRPSPHRPEGTESKQGWGPEVGQGQIGEQGCPPHPPACSPGTRVGPVSSVPCTRSSSSGLSNCLATVGLQRPFSCSLSEAPPHRAGPAAVQNPRCLPRPSSGPSTCPLEPPGTPGCAQARAGARSPGNCVCGVLPGYPPPAH